MSICAIGIIIVACYPELVSISSEDIINKCFNVKYGDRSNTEVTSKLIQNDILGEWWIDEENEISIIFNKNGTAYRIHSTVITDYSKFSIKQFNGKYVIETNINDVFGEFVVCGDELYHKTTNIVWKYRCRCFI